MSSIFLKMMWTNFSVLIFTCSLLPPLTRRLFSYSLVMELLWFIKHFNKIYYMYKLACKKNFYIQQKSVLYIGIQFLLWKFDTWVTKKKTWNMYKTILSAIWSQYSDNFLQNQTNYAQFIIPHKPTEVILSQNL